MFPKIFVEAVVVVEPAAAKTFWVSGLPKILVLAAVVVVGADANKL